MGTMMELNASVELSEEDLLFGDGASDERSALSDCSICLEADRYRSSRHTAGPMLAVSAVCNDE